MHKKLFLNSTPILAENPPEIKYRSNNLDQICIKNRHWGHLDFGIQPISHKCAFYI